MVASATSARDSTPTTELVAGGRGRRPGSPPNGRHPGRRFAAGPPGSRPGLGPVRSPAGFRSPARRPRKHAAATAVESRRSSRTASRCPERPGPAPRRQWCHGRRAVRPQRRTPRPETSSLKFAAAPPICRESRRRGGDSAGVERLPDRRAARPERPPSGGGETRVPARPRVAGLGRPPPPPRRRSGCRPFLRPFGRRPFPGDAGTRDPGPGGDRPRRGSCGAAPTASRRIPRHFVSPATSSSCGSTRPGNRRLRRTAGGFSTRSVAAARGGLKDDPRGQPEVPPRCTSTTPTRAPASRLRPDSPRSCPRLAVKFARAMSPRQTTRSSGPTWACQPVLQDHVVHLVDRAERPTEEVQRVDVAQMQIGPDPPRGCRRPAAPHVPRHRSQTVGAGSRPRRNPSRPGLKGLAELGLVDPLQPLPGHDVGGQRQDLQPTCVSCSAVVRPGSTSPRTRCAARRRTRARDRGRYRTCSTTTLMWRVGPGTHLCTWPCTFTQPSGTSRRGRCVSSSSGRPAMYNVLQTSSKPSRCAATVPSNS